MVQLPVDDYTLYVITDSDPYEIDDPFNYIAYLDTTNEVTYTALCNNIACDACRFQPICKGTDIQRALTPFIKEQFPELFI